MRAALLSRAQDDWAAVAKPDVAELLDDDLCERRELTCFLRSIFVSGDEPYLLALAAGVHGLGEGRDLFLGLLEVR